MALKVGRKPVGFLSQRQFLAAFAKKVFLTLIQLNNNYSSVEN